MTYAEKEANILAHISAHAGAPVQRSPEWLKCRQTVIGGSELAAVIGRNRYCSFDDLLRRKCGAVADVPGTACHWGVLFEPQLQAIVAQDLGTKVLGSGMYISGSQCGFPNLAYSPDGYCVVRLHEVDGANELVMGASETETETEIRHAVALLELKAPYRRWPTGGGRIPEHYLPQVLAGLALSPCAELGIYVEAVFRLCAREDLDPSTKYCWLYHHDRQKPLQCLDFGFISVYGQNEADGVVDFGKHYEQLDGALERLNSGRWVAFYGREGAPADGLRLIGWIPWKLFAINYLPVQRKKNFLEECGPRIDEFMRLLLPAKQK